MEPPVALVTLARGVLGEGYAPEVPARMLETIELLPSDDDRKQLFAILRMLDSKIGALALTGRPVPVSWLSPHEAETLLIRWRSSRLRLRQRLANSFIGLAVNALYGHPGPEWKRIGYAGPLGAAPDEPKRLQPLEISSDEELSCDVVVVGSGAGGGCVSAGLQAAGYDVIVLEKGGYHSESDFKHLEHEAARDLYLYGMTLSTTDGAGRIVAGSTLGGGTLVNFATSFRTPPHVLKEWHLVSGIDAFVSGEFEAALEEAAERVGVNTDSSAAGRRDALMEEGLKALGWHVDMMPRAVRGCTQDEQCGYCGFGCRVGGKQSTMRTYLEDAAVKGTRIVVNADVKNVVTRDGRADGVLASVDGHRLVVRARAVVVAGGSIETPALLLRSGLKGQVGRNLRLHPGVAPFASFDEEVRVWEGTTQARYSLQLQDWDGGYGPILETIPVHPGSLAVFLPWLSASQHRELMGRAASLSFCGVLMRDRMSGRVRIDKTGRPKIEYKITGDDLRRMTEGVIAGGRVLEAAGATEIFKPHARGFPTTYRPAPGAHERWAEELRRVESGQRAWNFGSWHQMGSCRMGTDPASSVVDANNESHEIESLFVTDASTFPTASGVNPMLSIYGIATRAAKKIAERLS
ncbi:MAG: GMC family oxidoreductase N-terminal domain-containing protein [Actinomycetota bacterium]